MWEHHTKRIATTDGSENIAYLGKDVRFKGEIHFEGTLQIDSHFEGEIHTKGVLTVGEHGVIKGTIHAGTVISGGKIKGNITAAEKVQLLKSAILVGDVHSPFFSMEEGAHIQGQIDMGASPWVDEPLQDHEGVSDLATRKGKLRPLRMEGEPSQ